MSGPSTGRLDVSLEDPGRGRVVTYIRTLSADGSVVVPTPPSVRTPMLWCGDSDDDPNAFSLFQSRLNTLLHHRRFGEGLTRTPLAVEPLDESVKAATRRRDDLKCVRDALGLLASVSDAHIVALSNVCRTEAKARRHADDVQATRTAMADAETRVKARSTAVVQAEEREQGTAEQLRIVSTGLSVVEAEMQQTRDALAARIDEHDAAAARADASRRALDAAESIASDAISATTEARAVATATSREVGLAEGRLKQATLNLVALQLSSPDPSGYSGEAVEVLAGGVAHGLGGDRYRPPHKRRRMSMYSGRMLGPGGRGCLSQPPPQGVYVL